MSVEEVWVAIAGTIVALIVWVRWYAATTRPSRLRGAPVPRGLIRGAPLLAALLIASVLPRAAASDVVTDGRYLYLYFVLGLAWVGVATMIFPATGLILRDDAVERRNPAVAPALAGAILGVALTYAGGNIGDGPGVRAVAMSAFAATAALMLTWLLLDAFTSVGDAITIDRDEAAGWRLGGFLVAAGLVLGRAVAGDWVSAESMLRDLAVRSWPLIGLIGVACAFESRLRSTAESPHPPVRSHGWIPGAGLVSLAMAWLVWNGLPA
jgi:uncharacterized membrane protein YjfL (UPF0719 family)